MRDLENRIVMPLVVLSAKVFVKFILLWRWITDIDCHLEALCNLLLEGESSGQEIEKAEKYIKQNGIGAQIDNLVTPEPKVVMDYGINKMEKI